MSEEIEPKPPPIQRRPVPPAFIPHSPAPSPLVKMGTLNFLLIATTMLWLLGMVASGIAGFLLMADEPLIVRLIQAFWAALCWPTVPYVISMVVLMVLKVAAKK